MLAAPSANRTPDRAPEKMSGNVAFTTWRMRAPCAYVVFRKVSGRMAKLKAGRF
jgi:hypothetical protein